MKTINDIVWKAIHTGENAEPWIVHGAPAVGASSTVTNPTPSKADVFGEILTLPFTVPKNNVLVILGVHFSMNILLANIAILRILITRPGVTSVSQFEKVIYNNLAGDQLITGSWYKELSSVGVQIQNLDTVAINPKFYIEGILVNYSEAFKKVRL